MPVCNLGYTPNKTFRESTGYGCYHLAPKLYLRTVKSWLFLCCANCCYFHSNRPVPNKDLPAVLGLLPLVSSVQWQDLQLCLPPSMLFCLFYVQDGTGQWSFLPEAQNSWRLPFPPDEESPGHPGTAGTPEIPALPEDRSLNCHHKCFLPGKTYSLPPGAF